MAVAILYFQSAQDTKHPANIPVQTEFRYVSGWFFRFSNISPIDFCVKTWGSSWHRNM